MPTGQRPAHIAMFNIAAAGHVRPSLDVIRELVDRGHRVTYAIPESYADLVASTGAEPKIYDSSLPTEADPDNWGAEPIDHMELFLDNAIHSLPSLAALYEDDVPDLVLFDSLTYAARVLGHRLNVPTVQLCPHLVPWEGYEEEMMATFGPMMETAQGRAYGERFTGWLKENGIDDAPDRFIMRPGRRVVLIPRAMQPNLDRVDMTLNTFAGSCQGDRADQGGWERPEDAEKVLLISLGSVFTKRPDFYRECLAAFGDLPGWHVVLQIGKHVDAADLGPIPANVEVSSWVPQLAILQQADAFVTHAGMGGSKEGLACGVPMVAVPQAADQFANADALAELGVARHLPSEEATAEALREAVLSLVADPAVAERSAALKAELAAERGTPYAADLIEAELRPSR
ncbi:macrolide-inactivating glycosyltransferase [Streptomyces griseocarneus]|nr:macrolide-inactivating glycosyltransferase [Streptomyces griseocarneus]